MFNKKYSLTQMAKMKCLLVVQPEEVQLGFEQIKMDWPPEVEILGSHYHC